MERKELLNKLITMNGTIEFLNSELAKLGWDSQEDLVYLKRQHIVDMFERFLRREITMLNLAEWADAVECREDIGFEAGYEKLIKQIVFELANPDVAGTFSEMKAKILLSKLG